jgi:hypothetical protein
MSSLAERPGGPAGTTAPDSTAPAARPPFLTSTVLVAIVPPAARNRDGRGAQGGQNLML